MKLLVLVLFISFNISWAQLTVSPPNIDKGAYNTVVFSGSSINFSQGTCVYVYLQQGTNLILQNGTSTYSAFTNFLSATFFVASDLTSGSYDIVFVDICQGTSTMGTVIKTIKNAIQVRSSSIVRAINDLFDFELFPNPVVENQVTIKQKGTFMPKNLCQIRDLTGKIVYSDVLQNSDQKISTESIAAGIYFVELFNENGQKSSKKIIIK